LTEGDGTPVGFHGTVTDITEHKAIEQRLQQSQKLEALGTLAAGISHDFNNILSGIFGYAQLAKTSLDNPRKTMEHIDQVLKAAQRAAELVQQVLAFSRGTGDRKKPFRIYLIVKESMKLLRSSFPAFIEMDTRLDSRQMVMADPAKIHQVIIGLCLNARQAMKKNGGKLTVSLTDEIITRPKQIQGSEIAAGNYLKLSVADTGHGMDEKTQAALTDPDAGAGMIGKATASGLTTVQSIVREHGGVMAIHSRPGKGTLVEIFFPVAGAEKKPPLVTPAPAEPPGSARTGRKTLMLVDDEKAIRQIYEEFFKGNGYEVRLFENGIDALNAFETDPQGVDLVITDMTMPALTGDKLAQKMLEIRPDIPIVMWCGFSEDISEDTAIRIGIRKYIQKPVSPRDLLQTIRRIFDEK
jgi:nitrogen-specific signal transduction histidine kinase